MSFTVASWNVEFFGSRRENESQAQVKNRISRVFDYLKDEIDADVYAICKNPARVHVEVKGWPEEPTPSAQGGWIRRFSDHALLRFTIVGVD